MTQFYKVAVDDAEPFYNVYGGTQDNNTLGGPSRTRTAHGIINSDWFITVRRRRLPDAGRSRRTRTSSTRSRSTAGSSATTAGPARRSTSSRSPAPGEPPLRWNWDSPLIISPHRHTRLYFAAQRVFRSDDRGDTWRPVSADLTRQIDRNKLKVMGRVWSVDAVAKNASTSFYGNIVSLAESPAEGRAALRRHRRRPDPGHRGRRRQLAEDRAASPACPTMTYVSRVVASRHDAGDVYATFDNHKMGDFKPYVLESTDRAARWTSIAGDLPERGTVYAVAEDPVKPDLLFAGTEFGVFFTRDGGATLGPAQGRPADDRGARPRDPGARERPRARDLRPRLLRPRRLLAAAQRLPRRRSTEEATLFPVRDAWMFIPSAPFGGREKAFLGDRFFTAPNPPFGAVFTYYLKDEIKTLRKTRRDAEKEKQKKGEDTPYPTWDDAARRGPRGGAGDPPDRDRRGRQRRAAPDRARRRRASPRRVGPPLPAVRARRAWPAAEHRSVGPRSRPGRWRRPGRYTVSLAKRVDGVVDAARRAADVRGEVPRHRVAPPDRPQALLAFQQKTARLQRAVLGRRRASRDEAQTRLDHLKKALLDTPGGRPELSTDARALEARLKDLQVALNGDTTLAPAATSRRRRRSSTACSGSSTGTGTRPRRRPRRSATTTTSPRRSSRRCSTKLRTLVESDLERLEDAAEAAGAPWTPGRVPEWKPE